MTQPAPPTPPQPSLVRRTAVGAGWMIAWRMFTRSLGFLSTLLLARILLPADFGLIAMATTFALAVEQMSQLGLAEALIRRRAPPHDLFDTAFTLQFGRSVATAAIVAACAPGAVWWFDEPRLLPVVLVLAASTIVAGLENIAVAEFRRDLRYNEQFKLLAAPRVVQVLLTVPLALLLHSYWALLAGILISKITRTVMTYWLHPFRPGLRLAGWRELAGFSFWTWATTFVALVWDRCDMFVLGPMLGPAALGVYLLAYELATLPITELIAPAAEAMFAGFASAQNRGASSVKAAPVVAMSLALVVTPVVIAISAAGGHLVPVLLGPNWDAAVPLVAIMAWLCLFSCFSIVSGSVLVANGHVRLNFTANLLASVAKLGVLVIATRLTRNLSIIAAAATAICALECVIFVGLLRVTREVRLRDIAGSLTRAAAAGAASAGTLVVTGLGWHSASSAHLAAFGWCLAIGGVSVTVFFAADLLLWTIAGRPAGPERHLLQAAGTVWRERRLQRFVPAGLRQPPSAS